MIKILSNTTKRRSERLRRRKTTLFKKAFDLGRDYDVDVAVIIRQHGRYYTFRSMDNLSWPPSMNEIETSYPLPKNMLPRDIQNKTFNSGRHIS
ncbi:uncharacterized protein EAF01_010144 [Botrytis porri]|uniref:MADS-box domain-containing protein n=1 Tax=Botrytis porri TaxID=87229 RepID=A0A4Z1L2V2_9HELO|nr:uncharacterized protein EAF01_010144 [Botrytis porri]KAF7894694.1 hypothetical protein EAF01_010144 [Botrytis porri]TGO90903.1 hypothetical protein BPOR_0047g00260 [Botrytis porri]